MRPGGRGQVSAVVAAQALVQIGAFTLPALLPHYLDAWPLTNTEAGSSASSSPPTSPPRRCWRR